MFNFLIKFKSLKKKINLSFRFKGKDLNYMKKVFNLCWITLNIIIDNSTWRTAPKNSVVII